MSNGEKITFIEIKASRIQFLSAANQKMDATLEEIEHEERVE
jgi:hypothetical protein